MFQVPKVNLRITVGILCRGKAVRGKRSTYVKQGTAMKIDVNRQWGPDQLRNHLLSLYSLSHCRYNLVNFDAEPYHHKTVEDFAMVYRNTSPRVYLMEVSAI